MANDAFPLPEHDFIGKARNEQAHMANFPQDMGFFPLSDKFSPDCPIKCPWLMGYIEFRIQHPDAGRSELLGYLHEAGADFSGTMDRFRGSLLGLAIGDALGTTLEFSVRDAKHIADLTGGGPFDLKPGHWTDDTSMACCSAYSLIKRNGFDAHHQMQCFCDWYRYGAYSPTGNCFDIGNGTRMALDKFLADGDPFAGSDHAMNSGNGSLMRLLPIALFYHDDFDACMHFTKESSRMTHPARECMDACRYLAALIHGALKGEGKDALLGDLYAPVPGYWEAWPLIGTIKDIALGSYKTTKREQLLSTGYVVDTLKAALWAFHGSSDFTSGMLSAVNLAGDADTIGAVYGQLAGAFYGEASMPIRWISKIYAFQGFYHFAQDLMEKSSAS